MLDLGIDIKFSWNLYYDYSRNTIHQIHIEQSRNKTIWKQHHMLYKAKQFLNIGVEAQNLWGAPHSTEVFRQIYEQDVRIDAAKSIK